MTEKGSRICRKSGTEMEGINLGEQKRDAARKGELDGEREQQKRQRWKLKREWVS